MKKFRIIYLLTLISIQGFGQIANDECFTAFDYGTFPFSAQPVCPNGASPYVGDNNDLTNATPSSPYYSMTGCQGYDSATTTFADDIWYKYKGTNTASNIWMFGLETLHVNFYFGINCNSLQPSGCFTYLPSYNDTIFTIYSNNDTINYYNYIQISSNVPGKQFGYFVCIDQPWFISAIAYGMIIINNTVSWEEVHNNTITSVYPNPLTNRLNITTTNSEKMEITLFDIVARKVWNETFVSSLSLNTESLAKGTYFYEMRNKYGIIKTGKIVKY